MTFFLEKYPTVDFIVVEGSQVEVINTVAGMYSHYRFMNWLGDDDRLPLDSIELSESVLKRNSGIRGTFGTVRYINTEGSVIGSYNPPKSAQRLICIIPAAIKLEAGLFYTSDFIKMKGIKLDLKYAPCVYTTIQLRKLGKWQKIDADLCEFRIHPDSETAANMLTGLREATKTQMKDANLLEKFLNLLLRYPFKLFKITIFNAIALRAKVRKLI